MSEERLTRTSRTLSWGAVVCAVALAIVVVGPVRSVHAQVEPSLYDYARPHLDWYTIETDHFNVVFHVDSTGAGSSRTAQVVARIAEEVYEPITDLYQHEPSTKVTFVLKDYEDYSNGAAYFFDNKIEIWAPALDSPLRGEHNWLRNVITHEFTHIVQVQKTMKAGRRMPFFYLQYLDYEEVRRPDVLYGYPNVLITYPIPVLNNPAWLAEGTAQYQRAGLHYDAWDSHRDMLLRTRVLAGQELELDDMGGFYSKTSLMREGVYNHGFAFVQYLAGTYGEDVLREISAALGRWDNWNVERAIEEALGVPGQEVYGGWIRELRREYETRTFSIRDHAVAGEIIEPDGFSNFHPRFSPDGSKLAYVSNRGEDFNRMSLYIRDLDSGELMAYEVDGLDDALYTHTCAFGHAIRSGVSGAFGWRPDGGALVYARKEDTRRGHLYSDLYELDLETREERRLTHNQRAMAPAYAPGGDRVVFVGHADGSGNLFVLDQPGSTEPEQATIQHLTTYQDGTQVTDPVWHPSGKWIYFARFSPDADGRDLYRIRPDGTNLESVLATEADERTPAFDADGQYLYYASDASGIFNLYRVPLPGDTRATQRAAPLLHGSQAERLTNVLGGAFMPSMGPNGRIAYAHYQWDGYKVARFDEVPTVPNEAQIAYAPPPITRKHEPTLASAEWNVLNEFDDTDVRPLEGRVVSTVRTEGSFSLGSPDEEQATASEGNQEVSDYGALFTSFTFYPVFRLDQYVSRERSRTDVRLPRRTRGETLLRNAKVGVYASSREVLEGMTLFGGLLLGPASTESSSVSDFFAPSRLLDLERDAFLSFEYKKGFGFIPDRWSPQLVVELFNIRRNVDNGLSVEEFPCTACLPDTTLADVSYNLWEASIHARSKVNRNLLLDVSYRFSPYRVNTDAFFSKEADARVPESSTRYFVGRAFGVKAYFEAMHPHRHDDVIPEGLEAELGYEYEPGRLLDRFELEDGILVPAYQHVRNHRLTLDARFNVRLPGQLRGGPHGMGLRLRATSILGSEVDDFFNDYVGGLIGARGYPFYALGGNETLWFQAAYHVPLFPRIGEQFAFAYLDKIYARLYADAAMAWSGPWPGLDAVRKDVGAELRFGLGSFYLLPTAVFVSGTYGVDAFEFQLDEGFVTPDGSNRVRYGKEWQWHFGVLLGFDT